LEEPASGTFSILSDAPSATVVMDASSISFFYELTGNVTFGSVIVGGTLLPAGTYTFSDLNALSPGSFIDGGGSITVAVPEPAAVSLLILSALGGGLLILRKRSLNVVDF